MAPIDRFVAEDRALSALTRLLQLDSTRFKLAWYEVFPLAAPAAEEITDSQWMQFLRNYGIGDDEIYAFLKELRQRMV
jgi:hypothetical protein